MKHDFSSVSPRSSKHLSKASRPNISPNLRESDDIFHELVEDLYDMVFQIDPAGRIQYVSQSVEKILGFPPEEVLGRTPLDFLSPEDRPSEEVFLNVLSKGVKLKRLEFSYLHRDGRLITLEANAVPFFGPDGALLGYRGVNRNTTKRHLAEIALAEAKKKIELILQSITDMYLVYDREWRFVEINPAAEKLMNAAKEQLSGKVLWDVFPRLRNTEIHANYFRAAETNSIQHFEAFSPVTGYWHEYHVYPSGEGCTVYMRDISVRREMEEKLRESEEAARALLNAASEAFFLVDTSGKILDLNRVAAERLGSTPAEMMGKRIHDFLPRDVAASRDARGHEVILTGSPVRFEDKRGESWLDTTFYPLFDSTGKVARLAIYSIDITGRKRFEGALQQANDELENKVRERTALLSKINQSLLAEIEERKRTERKLRKAQKYLRAMAAEMVVTEEKSRQRFATELHDSVVQTLAAAKMRSELLRDLIPPEGVPFFTDLHEMISQSISEARLIMSEMSPPVLYELGLIPAIDWICTQVGSMHNLQVKFTSNYKGEQPSHEVQVMLFQAARELLVNVVKHSCATRADVSVSGSRGIVRLTVRDDGKGFESRVSFRPDLSGGFGLFSIRERLRSLGGQLTIHSKKGQGTRVVLVSPIVLI